MPETVACGSFAFPCACLYIGYGTYARKRNISVLVYGNRSISEIQMMRTIIEGPTDGQFGFWHTVNSHGWCVLPPFEVDRDTEQLVRLFVLRGDTQVKCVMRHESNRLILELSSHQPLTKAQTGDALSQARECLRLDEDLSEFYKEARRYPHYRWIARHGAGRLLRAPTVFEDVVKMICTTNCSWALTETMVKNLTQKLGKPFDDRVRGFPTPGELARVSERFLRENIRTGYRSPFISEFARNVAEGRLHVEQWRSSALSTEELFDEVRSIKGVGAYAAGNLLKLLGRYDYLGLDSWVRAQYYELHRKGRRVSDATIERDYVRLGRWRGLFFWLEMTRHWYRNKFPF